MFRKPIFWAALFAISAGSIFFSTRYFARAFPIVSIDLRMNREAALAGARELAGRLQLPPSGARQVASFGGDQEVQNFVELEGGGAAAFKTMMARDLYHPYKWSVRHFKTGETKETRIFFTPRGDAYGFAVKLPEKEAGSALPQERAREIAEQAATRDWRVDLGRYRPVEQSREVRPGGRIDHTFVYERPDVQAGEGRYRLRLAVSGDRLTELVHFVKVPEAFERRYEEMRSANNVIGASGSIALVVLYIVGGCAVGLFFLMRQRWIVWRAPLLWGVFIAFLQLLAGINQWPLVWLGYDTAIPSQSFVAQQIVMLIFSSLMYAGLFSISFMAAESLSRKAFPQHLQQWRLWGPELAGSREVLGRTVAGYLLVAIFFAYEVFLYFFASKSLGWWTPSDLLVQPDILANYLPWLTPIAVSAQAGFWEEALFRAVPLAGAALLGSRFGKRNWWIAGAMVLQALIFGSGHAGYANQPSYARVVELIIPSLMFGGIYLRFGLLASIILHYVFDVVWFALPLFVASSPGIWVDRGLLIAFVLVPLGITVAGRLRAGKWFDAPDDLRNRAWQPPEPDREVEAPQKPVLSALHPLVARFLPVAGAAGLVLWGFATTFRTDAPPLTVTRGEAEKVARQALAERGIPLSAAWTALPSVQSRPGEQDRFVWQTAGKESYRKLMNEYLSPPHWSVRFVRFEGDVAERAEEFGVAISDAKGVYRVRHILPEARPGKSLSEPEARDRARGALKNLFAVDPGILKEISAAPSRLKARTDWVFTFSDPRPPQLPQGEKRISVHLGGEEVVDAYRFVHVPEEWERQDRERGSIPSIARVICSVIAGVIVAVGCGLGIFFWSRRRFAVSTFALLFVALLGLELVSLLNSVPVMKSQFSTAQPFKVQMFILLGVSLLGVLLLSAALALMAGMLRRWCAETERVAVPLPWVIGISVGVFAAGVSALGSAVSPSLAPVWPDLTSLATYAPSLESAIGPLNGYLMESVIALFLFAAIDQMSRMWSRKRAFYGALLFGFGFVLAGMRSLDSIPSWLMAGAIVGSFLLAAYWLVIRFSLPVVLIAAGSIQILAGVKRGIAQSLPGGSPAVALGLALAAAGVWYWHRHFTENGKVPEVLVNGEGS